MSDYERDRQMEEANAEARARAGYMEVIRAEALDFFEAYSMKSEHTTLDRPYLPLPNSVEVVVTHKLAPAEYTKTAFMLPLRRPGSELIMANNLRRGLEFAGGHIEPGETAKEAAIRECLEETGYMVRDVRPIGFLRMISEGPKPDGWRYPHPVSFQQFFAGTVWIKQPYESNDECGHPQEIRPERATEIMSASRMAFYKAAVASFEGDGL